MLFYLYIQSFEQRIEMCRMLPSSFCVRLNIWKQCLIMAITAAWISLIVLKMNYPVIKAFFTVKGMSQGRHLTLPGISSPENSMLKSAEHQSNDRRISTKNSSIQKSYRKNETKYQHGKSSTITVDIVPSTLVYPLFQPAEETEFPTSNGDLPRIPHIIHQMYANETIPEMYINHVKSFIKNNPTWTYRFWTDESGRRLLQKHHPYLVQIYDNFGNNVKRSDLLRYAVLYEYGGFYADLDMDNLRSLNITTIKYACIVPVEPFEHSVLLYSMDFVMTNAIMSCRPKHPFFKLLLWNLREANPNGYPVDATGPAYVTSQFISYNHIGSVKGDRNKTDWTSNSPYFYKGELREDDNDSVYVPNSQYFMDKIDPAHVKQDGRVTLLCKRLRRLSYRNQRVCSEFYSRKALRRNKKYTFTVHHWYHLWGRKPSSVDKLKKINISDIVSNCILYHE